MFRISGTCSDRASLVPIQQTQDHRPLAGSRGLGRATRLMTCSSARRLLNAECGLVKRLSYFVAQCHPIRLPIRLFKNQRCNQVRQACQAADLDLTFACPQYRSVRIDKADDRGGRLR